MPRKKMLDLGASKIQDVSVEFVPEKAITGNVVDRISLKVETSEDVYCYTIGVSRSHATLEEAKNYLEVSLEKARQNYSKVKIHEDKDRTELTLMIQDEDRVVFTGKRLPNQR